MINQTAFFQNLVKPILLAQRMETLKVLCKKREEIICTCHREIYYSDKMCDTDNFGRSMNTDSIKERNNPFLGDIDSEEKGLILWAVWDRLWRGHQSWQKGWRHWKFCCKERKSPFALAIWIYMNSDKKHDTDNFRCIMNTNKSKERNNPFPGDTDSEEKDCYYWLFGTWTT